MISRYRLRRRVGSWFHSWAETKIEFQTAKKIRLVLDYCDSHGDQRLHNFQPNNRCACVLYA